ncbi:RNA exonuclease 4 isoform X2 [Phyllostomus discolor]|uniref:RNA exonuclease 4 n=1 Tax=Phyllostomus discolor TaxID=89673 RepID=A0A7E6DGZ6_9CHIR|nr:RNA exonuclease 4 isoform X2 [Phyllostomus discolor]
MAKAKAPTPKSAPGDPAAEPGLVKKPARKKKKKLWKSKAPDASKRPPSDPKVELRPPKAPEDFSQNWKALQELLKQKPQALGKPLVASQADSRKQPRTLPGTQKAKRGRTGAEKAHQEAPAGPAAPAPPTQGSGAKHGDKGTKRRTGGDPAPTHGDLKCKKRKAEEATARVTPAPPTEEDIWFDDVDPADIEAAIGPEAARVARQRLGGKDGGLALEKQQAFGGLTRAVAMDCEMVGVGPSGAESAAARVSVVNQHGKCVYDKYIRPARPVTDYRTAVSGIRPEHLQSGERFEVVQKEVAAMLKGRVLVGHALHNDLKVLFLDHPRRKIRDTQKYKPFKSQVRSGRPSLKLLAERILGIRVQQAEHCSVQDAQAAMRLYVLVRKEWERQARDRRPAAVTPSTGTCDHAMGQTASPQSSGRIVMTATARQRTCS